MTAKCCQHGANLHGDTITPPTEGARCRAVVNGMRLRDDDSPLAVCECGGWAPAKGAA